MGAIKIFSTKNLTSSHTVNKVLPIINRALFEALKKTINKYELVVISIARN